MTTKPIKLTPAQEKALNKFSQPGGHGYGEFSYIARPTAERLKALGFVQLGFRAVEGRPSLRWGILTQAGVDALNEIRKAKGLEPDPWNKPSDPVYGWRPGAP